MPRFDAANREDMQFIDRAFREFTGMRDGCAGALDSLERQFLSQRADRERYSYAVDRDLLWLLTAIRMRRISNDYMGDLMDAFQDFCGFERSPEQAAANQAAWAGDLFDYIADMQIEGIGQETLGDIQRMLLVCEASRRAAALRERYPAAYQERIGSDPAREELFRERMQQAQALQNQLRTALDVYHAERNAERVRNEEPEQENPYIEIADDFYPGADAVGEMTEELSNQFVQKNSARRNGTSPETGVNLRVPAGLKALAGIKDGEIGQIREEDRVMAEKMAESIFRTLMPDELQDGGMIRGGKDGQKMEKEDLIFINGQSLRQYALAHLPADQRSNAAIRMYSGALLAREMQSGKSRISFAQASGLGNGRYDVTLHPVRLDLRDCQPAIRDDESYSWIRRTIFNWGPFKCKTRQEKAEESYADPALRALENGLKEKLNREVDTGRQDSLLLSTNEQMWKWRDKTRQFAMTVKNELGTLYEDPDPRDLHIISCMLMIDKLDLPPAELEATFDREMKAMVNAFYSPDMEKRKQYLDRMGDFLDSFDPAAANLNDPKDMFRMQVYAHLQQPFQTKSRNYPEWYFNRYDTVEKREKYHQKISYNTYAASALQYRAEQLTGRRYDRHFDFSQFQGMSATGAEDVAAVAETIHSIAFEDVWKSPDVNLRLRLPARAAEDLRMSPEQLSRLEERDEDRAFLLGINAMTLMSDAPNNLLNGPIENTIYIDGLSLKEYVDGLVPGTRWDKYAPFLLQALASGEHHVELATLVVKEDGKWDIAVKPVEPDLSAVRAGDADGLSSVSSAAAPGIENPAERDQRINTIRGKIRNILQGSLPRANELRREHLLPLIQLSDSIGINQPTQQPTMAELREQWAQRERRRVEVARQRAENMTQTGSNTVDAARPAQNPTRVQTGLQGLENQERPAALDNRPRATQGNPPAPVRGNPPAAAAQGNPPAAAAQGNPPAAAPQEKPTEKKPVEKAPVSPRKK